MKNHQTKEAYYERLRLLADVNKTSLKESKTRTLGTLIDYKRAADGVAYGIIKENHHYYIKKGGIKQDPDVSDFAYIGGLENISNFQYKSLSEADKNRNMLFNTINETYRSHVGKQKLHEDKAGEEIDSASEKLDDLDAATAKKKSGDAEMAAGLEGEPQGGEEMPAEEPAPEGGEEMPAEEPAPEGGEEDLSAILGGEEAPAEEPAPEGGEEMPAEEPAPEGDEEAPAEEPAPEGGEEMPAEEPEGEGPDAEELAAEDPIKEIERTLGKLTDRIRKTELEPNQVESFVKTYLTAFKDKFPEVEIEDRKELANKILKVVPPEDVASLSADMPADELPMAAEGKCNECGSFSMYAESMGFDTPQSLMECGEEEVTNLIGNYANHHMDGMNDGDPETVATVIKVRNPEMLDTLKNDYGHDEYVEKLRPHVESMNEATEEESMQKLQELWSGVEEKTDPAMIETQPEKEEEGIKFAPEGQSMGVGVVAPSTTMKLEAKDGTMVEVTLNEVMRKLKKTVSEAKVKEGNAFTAGLAKTPKGGTFKVDGKTMKDTSNYDKKNVEEGKKPVEEKWEKDVKVKKTGEHAGKTMEELKKELAALKEKSKKYQDADKKVPQSIIDQEAEIKFALRAKGGWKKKMEEEVEEGKKPVTESEQKLRKYIRQRLEEKAGLRKATLNESAKSPAMKKLDEMIDRQLGLYNNVVKKKLTKNG